jgi:hypothetical protein
MFHKISKISLPAEPLSATEKSNPLLGISYPVLGFKKDIHVLCFRRGSTHTSIKGT